MFCLRTYAAALVCLAIVLPSPAQARQNNTSSKTALATLLIDAIHCLIKNRSCIANPPKTTLFPSTPFRGCASIQNEQHRKKCAKILLDRITKWYHTHTRNNTNNISWVYEVARFKHALDVSYTYNISRNGNRTIATPRKSSGTNEERYLFFVLRTVFQKYTTIQNLDIEKLDTLAYAEYVQKIRPLNYNNRL